MMSSGDIQRQMGRCGEDIHKAEAELRRLEAQLDNQESVRLWYKTKREDYLDTLETQTKLLGNIAYCAERAALAQQYDERLSDDLRGRPLSNRYDSADNIDVLLKSELNKTQDGIDKAVGELTALRNRLEQLAADYENALQTERVTADKAAAAEWGRQ